MPKKAVAYARYSSENQHETSIEAQLQAIRRYANEKDIELMEPPYVDRAKSASHGPRPAFKRMLEDSAKGEFHLVLVHKLDRFGRRMAETVLAEATLEAHGVQLVSVTEPFDGSPMSHLIKGFTLGTNAWYVANLRDEVMKGMKVTASKCLHTGGTPPLGYRVDSNKRYVVDNYEAETVRLIFKLAAEGNGYRTIITELNALGMRTKKGRPFGKNSLHDILVNEKYTGVYIYNRSAQRDPFGKRNNHATKSAEEIVRIEGGLPAIISKELFTEVQLRKEKNKQATGSFKAKEHYLLSGLIFCGECGSAMSGQSRVAGKKKVRYASYRCGKKDRNKTCKNKDVRKEYIEELVLRQIEGQFSNDAVLGMLHQAVNKLLLERLSEKQVEARKYTLGLKALQRKITNLVEALANQQSQAVMEHLSNLEQEKSELQKRLNRVTAIAGCEDVGRKQLKDLLDGLRNFVSQEKDVACREFIKSCVKKVLVFEDHVEVIWLQCHPDANQCL